MSAIDRIVAALTLLQTSDRILDVDAIRALEQTISHLNAIQTALVKHAKADPSEWIPTLRHDFGLLHNLGIWPESIEPVMKEIEEAIASSCTLERMSTQAIPETGLRLPENLTNTRLPPELLSSLEKICYLHILATEPDKVITPGKSIVTGLMTNRRSFRHQSALHERVEDIAHGIFWEEVIKILSDPLPSVIIPRLNLLYADLHTALSPLIPAEDPAMILLSLPLSPTSAPLRLALINLQEVLTSMQRRCAPLRDVDIEAIRRPMEEYNPASPSSTTLPKLIADSARSILKLSENMKGDLDEYLLGNTDEQQLVQAIDIQAKRQERAVLEIISGSEHRISEELVAWLRLDELAKPSRKAIIARLLEALRSKYPVGCILHPTNDDDPHTGSIPENRLPSLFYFVTPSLLRSQNLIQAVVITASLRTLVRLPAQKGHELAERLLTLLKIEIDGKNTEGDEPTKLVNLADEVVHAVKEYEGCDEFKETMLRKAVNRVLNEADPVFLLLQKRVIEAIEKVFDQHMTTRGDLVSVIPPNIRSGFSLNQRHHPFGSSLGMRKGKSAGDATDLRVGVIKGFEDASLSQTIEAIARRIWGDIQWVTDVGVDLITL